MPGRLLRLFVFAAALAPVAVSADDLASAMAIEDAWKVETPCRVRYSLNGLWQCRDPQSNGWDVVRVPKSMPGKNRTLVYRRAFRMPDAAKGKRVLVTIDRYFTRVKAALDGESVGEYEFPEGEIDLTPRIRPGTLQTLELTFSGYHWSKDAVSYNAGDREAKRETRTDFWGGGPEADVWLDILPKGVRLIDPWVECSVARGEIAFRAEGEGLPSDGVKLVAEVSGCGESRRFDSGIVRPSADGSVAFIAKWKDARLWNPFATTNVYSCALSAYDAKGRLLDAAIPFSFGFREVSISGNRLLMNGVPVHLRILLAPVACQGVDLSCDLVARETCRRLRAEGYNCITDQYGSNPGSFGYLEGIAKACDESGVLYIHTLPHVKDYGGVAKFAKDAKWQSLYRRVARHYVKAMRNHPSVIAWTINHNMVGRSGDSDPLGTDGHDAPDATTQAKVRAADLSWSIVKGLDPTRPCYHHAGGDTGDIRTTNNYLDWVPRQERSDWFEWWATNGTKPWINVEWGMPHIANWSTYRGPQFIWDSFAFQSTVAQEASATAFGDRAFADDETVRVLLAYEESLWAKGKPWSWRNAMCEKLYGLRQGVFDYVSWYVADNCRSMRGWGVTGTLPWDQKRVMFTRKASMKLKDVTWPSAELKRPGVVPDHTGRCLEYFISSPDVTDWEPTEIARTIRKWNQDDCAFIGGDGVFTDKAHNFRAGEEFRKRLVFVNDRFAPRDYAWRVRMVDAGGVTLDSKSGRLTVAPGTRGEMPIAFTAPQEGAYALEAEFSAPGWTSDDRFTFASLALPTGKFARAVKLYDPKGLTATNFDRLKIPYVRVTEDEEIRAAACLEKNLVIGREGLTKRILDLVLYEEWSRARVLVFEQTRETLESIGLRVQEYGVRNAFPRFADPELGPLDESALGDWAGSSTLIAPYVRPAKAGKGQSERYCEELWAGYPVCRPFRAGHRAAVATVLPETPTQGDWRPLVDCGWGLQYSPLLDWRVEFGRVTLCQFDVTGRTVPDIAADDLVRRLVVRLANGGTEALSSVWVKPHGKEAWTALLNGNWGMLEAASHPGRQVHLVTSGAEKPDGFDERVAREGLRVLCVGLGEGDVRKWSPIPVPVTWTNGAYFARFEHMPPELNGVSNANLAWHGAMSFAAFASNAPGEGTASLRVIRHGKGYYVFMQLAPWAIDDFTKPYLRATKRRTWALFGRILGAMDAGSRNHRAQYADAPVRDDDPYRFFNW